MNVKLVKPTVKMRAALTGSSGGGKSYSLTVPSEMARIIEKAGIDTFEVDFTPDGILYRPVESAPEPVLEVPEWLKASIEAVESELAEDNGKAKVKAG